MDRRPADRWPADDPATTLDAGFRIVIVLAFVSVAFAIVVALQGHFAGGSPGTAAGAPSASTQASATAALATPMPPTEIASFLYPTTHDAPPISLTDPDGQTVTLTSLRGGLVLVFFGYTHCPDVCPATIGIVHEAIAAYGPGVRALFVTIDPERDTTISLKQSAAYMPAGFTALTGTSDEIRSTADAWGVRYARVETGIAGAYSMSHTADVFVVDAAGRLRADFPFGTQAAAMAATLRVIATAGPTASTSAAITASPISSAGAPALDTLRVQVVSSSVWADGPSPVILALFGPAGRLDDTSIRPAVQLTTSDGNPIGSPVEAVPVRPVGLTSVSYVTPLDIPAPGSWSISVTATPGVMALHGTANLTALDQGGSVPIGSAAPPIHSPTLADVGGDPMQVTTDPIPDLRLYRTSTSDALAQHLPFVLVLDSTRFRVTTACGKALTMARYLQDRWPAVTFIHDEPFRYEIVTNTPVLDGSLADPQLTDVAAAWGIGADPWGPRSMPWVFIVDANGIVRAKYQGIMGTDDVDVIVALMTQGG
jgi:protein SCO1/2